MTKPPVAMLSGSTVFRVVWLPGSDRLRGYCWCCASHESEGPVELWTWLLAHPATHGGQNSAGMRDPAPRELEPASFPG